MREFLRLGYLQTQTVINRLDAFGPVGIVHGDYIELTKLGIEYVSQNGLLPAGRRIGGRV